MPVLNAADYLADAIESILCQTFRDFELILIDDGSTDDSLRIATRLNDPRLKVFRNDTNLGVAASLNLGISRASGCFLARMDADDISRLDRFERQLDFMRRHPRIGVCGTWVRCLNVKTRFLYRYPNGPACVKAYQLFANPLAHPSVMIDRHKFEKHHLHYDTRYAAAQDYALWVRCSRHFPMDNLSLPLVDVRLNEQGVTRSNFLSSNETSLEIQRTLLSEVGLVVSDALLRFHRQVGNGSGMRSEAELRAAAKWLSLVVQANEHSRIYDQEGLRRAVSMVWFRICLNSAWMGPRIFRYYLHKSLWGTYRPGWDELITFIINALTPTRHRGPAGRLPMDR